MAGLDVTSVARELGWTGLAAEPSTESVRTAGERFGEAFGRRLDEAVVESTQQRGRMARPATAGV